MAGMLEIGSIPNFDCKGEISTLSQRWQRWKRAFELFVASKAITDTTQKRALLLHCAGMDVQDIFYTLSETGDETNYAKAMEKLSEYFQPKANVPFERHQFRQMKQENGETVEQFVTRLKDKANTCEFGDHQNEHIRDQVIDKCKSHNLRKKFLEKGKITLENMVGLARASEAADRQAAAMEGGAVGGRSGAVNAVRKTVSNVNKDSKRGSCYRCGYTGHYARDSACPARNKECSRCHQMGHFEKMCKTGDIRPKTQDSHNNSSRHSDSRQTHDSRRRGSYHNSDSRGGRQNGDRQQTRAKSYYVDAESDDEYSFGINLNAESSNMVQTYISGIPLEMCVDSGSTCNIIDKGTWNELKSKHIQCKTEKVNKRLYTYGSTTPLKLLGKVTADLSMGDEPQGRQSTSTEFFVVDGEGVPLLGKVTSMQLGILKIGPDISFVSDTGITTKYKEYFTGIGKLTDHTVKLHIDNSVKPVVQPVRRIPFALREKVEAKLVELEQLDIIEHVEGPTSWVSPVVIVPKPSGEIRLCVDMRRANEAIIRERHPIPTVDEMLHDMSESRVFSKLDLKWGFHQLELSEESRDITTFVTHKGLYRYKRLMFGVNAAPEIYQHTIQQVLQSCEGAENMSDDIIIHGRDTEEHDKRLVDVIETLGSRGLTLNADKCQFRLPKLEFLGHVLSDKGLSPAEAKVKAVKDARPPENATEVRSFLGLVNFNAKFIPNLASCAEPLRRLTRKHEPFVWGSEQQKSFDSLKEHLADAETLGYFDKKAKTQVIADASPVGLGSVLVQIQHGEPRVIRYASRSLSDVEKRYSQTEKEALALVWACEKFHLYLYGIDFELVTDHKPLEVIYSRKSKPSARIERWVLRLQPYSFTVHYIPGPQNIADSLSRLSVTTSNVQQSRNVAEEYVQFVATQATPHSINIQEVEQESAKDEELRLLRHCIQSGDWKSDGISVSYRAVKDELCVLGNLVLRGTKIVIPESLRKKVLIIAHEGHQGCAKTKERLRTKVWWPKIDRDAEQICRQCYACQLVGLPSVPEPIKTHKLPEKPWQHLAIDLMGPFPSGESVLVVVDYYSRFFEVSILKSTTALDVIDKLDEIFARFGLPESIKSDNGPQFVSAEFKSFLDMNCIVHHKSTPIWPQANGEVERQNRSLLKAIRTAQVEQRDWRKELTKFLTAYRTTPHSTTGMAPSAMMFRYDVRTKLPSVCDNTVLTGDGEHRDRDSEYKLRGQVYADRNRRARHSDITVGDRVLLQQRKTNKLSTMFEPSPYDVIERRGNEVTIQSQGGTLYKRNISHVKRFVDNPEPGVLPTPDVDVDANASDDPVAVDETRFSDSDASDNNVSGPVAVSMPLSPQVSSRPRRDIKVPERFSDFVLG
jgi:transposase InsO family protein